MSLALHCWVGDVHHCSGPRLWNDLYCVEWDIKLYYTIPYLNWPISIFVLKVPLNPKQPT